MGLTNTIADALSGADTTTEREQEFQEFQNRRQWERDVFKTAIRDWVLKSGLGPLMIEQTQENYGALEGIEAWPPEQFDHFDHEKFDTRRPTHQEIADYIDGHR